MYPKLSTPQGKSINPMNTTTHSTKTSLYAFFLSTVAIIALYVLVQHPYILSDFIFGQDDTIYIPKVFAGVPQGGPAPHLFIHVVMSILAPFHSIPLH